MDKLPDWPKRDDELIERYKEWWCLIDRDFLMEYERDLRKAWESRCRVAVEALREVSTIVDSASDRLLLLSEIEAIQGGRMKYPQDVCNRVNKISVAVIEKVADTIAAIGELPK